MGFDPNIFFCPFAGYYYFGYNVHKASSSTNPMVQLMLNGKNKLIVNLPPRQPDPTQPTLPHHALYHMLCRSPRRDIYCPYIRMMRFYVDRAHNIMVVFLVYLTGHSHILLWCQSLSCFKNRTSLILGNVVMSSWPQVGGGEKWDKFYNGAVRRMSGFRANVISLTLLQFHY